MEISEKVKEMREKMQVNRKEFAEHFSIPLRTIEDWEAGRRKPPEYLPRLMEYQIAFEKIVEEKRIVSQKEERNVNIITDADGNKIVFINDKRFRGVNRQDWKEIETYLARYVGECYEIAESSEKIYIDRDMPDEFTNSKERISLKGANRKAKANASQGIPELIQIATNPKWEKNKEEKHLEDAAYGWYRYEVNFALPVYDDQSGELVRYNIYSAKMLVRHDIDGKKYLYDLLAIKKETSSPHDGENPFLTLIII